MNNGSNENINSNPEPGWYPDPSSPRESGAVRFWDGQAWTEQVKKPTASPPSPTIAPPSSFDQSRGYQQNMPPYQQQYSGAPSQLVMSPFGQYYSGWWRRVGATMLDGIIVGSIVFPVLLLVFFVFFFSLSESDVDLFLAEGTGGTALTLFTLLAVLFASIVSFLYQVLQLGMWGKTIGDRALGIRVASEKTGEVCSWGAATKRTLILSGFSLGGVVPLVGVFFSLAGIVNYFSMLWDPQRRCWHDLVGGTVVLKTRP